MPSRKIIDLVPELQTLYNAFEEKMEEEGIDFIVTCTYRPQEEQDRLYARGRTAPGFIVTWTKKSKHTKHEAFDIAVLTNGKLNWGNKAYDRPGEIGESLGLKWGGRFKKIDGTPQPDRPHFELANIVELTGGVLDTAASVASTGVAGKEAKTAATVYNAARKAGLMVKVGRALTRFFNFIRG